MANELAVFQDRIRKVWHVATVCPFVQVRLVHAGRPRSWQLCFPLLRWKW